MFLCPACTGPPRTNDNPRMLSLASFVFAAAVLQTPSPVAPPPDATGHARTVLSAIAAEEFTKVEEEFTSEMKAALPPGRLAAMWTMLELQAGAYKSCGANPRVRRICGQGDGDHGVRVRAGDDRRPVRLRQRRPYLGTSSFRPVAKAEVPTALPPMRRHRHMPRRRATIGSGEWALPGTLTLPVARGSFPAVVLVHGSGANDRDETIGINKPFKDLAAGLASRGIAVLRYDKRTRVHGWEGGGPRRFHCQTGGDRGRAGSGEGPARGNQGSTRRASSCSGTASVACSFRASGPQIRPLRG